MKRLADKYGGKRAYLIHLRSRLDCALGTLSPLSGPVHGTIRRLVFVCKGNICRSPFAEAYASRLGIETISAGFEATSGSTANDVAIAVARSRGLSLASHRARHLSEIDIAEHDLIFIFEPKHSEPIRRLPLSESHPVRLLGTFATPRYPYIQDPYGLSPAYFQNCFARIAAAIDNASALIPNRSNLTAHG